MSQLVLEVTQELTSNIVRYFDELPDPRSTVNRLHLLGDVIVIAICAILGNADGPTAIATWAKLNEEVLKRHLTLANGIPEKDCYRRILSLLSPRDFQCCFAQWIDSLQVLTDEQKQDYKKQIAIDGKVLRRSHDKKNHLGALVIVSAWATDQGVSLGQVATEAKSNEIKAIPQLLKDIDIEDSIITIDAAGCQKNIAQQIIDGKADYILALKGNQPNLFAAAQDFFLDHLEDDFARYPVSRFEEMEKGHGRLEHRTYFQATIPKDFHGRDEWAGFKTIGLAIRNYIKNDVEHSDVRYYISSLRRNGKLYAKNVRGHWGIENTLHWSLDMTYREDESRVRNRNFAQNLSWLRKLTLSLIKKHPGKESNIMKRRMAAWSIDYLMQVLTGQHT